MDALAKLSRSKTLELSKIENVTLKKNPDSAGLSG